MVRWRPLPITGNKQLRFVGPTLDTKSLKSQHDCRRDDLADRIPTAFAVGSDVLLVGYSGTAIVSFNEIHIDCNTPELIAKFQVPDHIEQPVDAYFPVPYALVIIPEESPLADQDLRLIYSINFPDSDLSSKASVAMQAPRKQVQEEHGLSFIDPDPDLQASLTSTSPVFKWLVPSAGILAASKVRSMEVDRLQTHYSIDALMGHEDDGELHIVTQPFLFDMSRLSMGHYIIGSIDLDGDGNQELISNISIHSSDLNETFETFELTSYNVSRGEFISVGLGSDERGAWPFFDFER
jgi:hypothetical protein